MTHLEDTCDTYQELMEHAILITSLLSNKAMLNVLFAIFLLHDSK